MATPDLKIFSVDALTALMIADFHRRADAYNTAQIQKYNDAVAYHEGPKGGMDPVPTPPLLQQIHDDMIKQFMAAEGVQWDNARVVTYYRYLPPAPVQPPAPPAPLNPVGMWEGQYQGRDIYQVLPYDPRPIGASFADPERGWVTKISIPFWAGPQIVWQAAPPQPPPPPPMPSVTAQGTAAKP